MRRGKSGFYCSLDEKTNCNFSTRLTSVPPACRAFLSNVSSSEYWRSDCSAESMFFAAFSNDSVDIGLLTDVLVVIPKQYIDLKSQRNSRMKSEKSTAALFNDISQNIT